MASKGPTLTPRTLHTSLEGHNGSVHVVRYSKGSAAYVMTGGQDRTVRLWNPNTGGEVKAFKAHGYEVLSVTIAHDNASFASSGGDRSVFVWDVATGQTTRRIPGHMGKINAVEFNQDASVVVSGSFDATVRVWDLRATSRQAIQELKEARDAIQCLHVGPTEIISGSVDGHVRTYDLRMGELRSDYLGHPVTSIVPTIDGQTLLVATLDSRIRLIDRADGRVLNTFQGMRMAPSVIAGDEQGRIWTWDLVDASVMEPNPPPAAHKKVTTWVEQRPNDPNQMVSASADGSVKVWTS
ncbi:nuclear mRNA splicing protein [Auriculariales sp. MPI-PUGE-AT-0066]|nr:nuclear mRNA splicing protein [Auriculariales sp. MPI-PUGE-AT-0066]